MKLYIPEIGDSFVLAKDWNFTLYAEGRNATLAALHGYGVAGFKFFKLSEVPEYQSPPPVYHPPYKNYERLFGGFDVEKYTRDIELAQKSNVEYIKWLAFKKEYDEKLNIELKKNQETLLITIPAGTTLTVDRIYIRKGKSDYSSVTFLAQGLGTVEINNSNSYGNKKKIKHSKHRFWVKLQDCNQIEIKND